MVTIIGSGFGRYGYEPAIRNLGDTANGVVIAVPPSVQPEIARQQMSLPDVHTLLLEKPLAETPDEAERLLNDLNLWGGRYRIGYLFGDTDWGRQKHFEQIEWKFQAYHFLHNLHNWKRRLGVVRYYGIHIIALLAERGYREVAWSYESETEWDAGFLTDDLSPCAVYINACSDITSYVVNGTDHGTPWGVKTRVDVLTESLRRFFASSDQPNYQPSIDLWRKVEAWTW